MSIVAESQRKGLGTVLLALEPLTQEEKSLRRRIIRVLVYADGAVLALFIILFSPEWWIVCLVWLFLSWALITWYSIAIRRSVRAGRLTSSPQERTKAQLTMSKQLRTTPIWCFGLTAVGVFAGLTNHRSQTAAFVVAGVSFALGVAGLILAARWRRRIPKPE
jgi:Ca2+/Na+ antiporter